MRSVCQPAPGMEPRTRRRPGVSVVCALVISLAFLPAFAAEDDTVIFPADAPKSESVSVPNTSNLNTMTLGVALLLAGVGGWFVWRNRRGSPLSRSPQALAIDETRSLGNRQYLVVASYEGKKFLLGVCPGHINLLSPLGDSSGQQTTPE